MRLLHFILAVLIVAVGSLCKGWAQFGKNKIQYVTHQWQVLATTHFDVYYPTGYRRLGDFAAVVAESVLPRIEHVLGFTISDRIPIVVYHSQNEFQETNIVAPILPEGVGGLTELMKNRVVVPYDGNWEQFRHVVEHELVHGMINQMFYGGSLQSVLLRTNLPELPIWMNEGLCEYISLNGLDADTDMFLRDVVMSEQLPPLRYLNGYLAYRGGQSFYWFIEYRYGRRKITELLQRLTLVKRLSEAVEQTFGKSLKELSQEWEKFLKKRYWPDIGRFADIDEEARRLTAHQEEGNFYNSSPAIAPDGERIAFISDRDGVFGIYVMEIDREKPRIEVLLSSQRSPDFEELNILTPGISWSPDGRRLAIAAKYKAEDALYVYDLESGNYQRYAWGFEKLQAVEWSPDGRYIAFAAVRNAQPDIFVWDIQQDTLINLTNDPFTDNQPTWKDSTGLFFISDRQTAVDPHKPWQWRLPRWDVFFVDLHSRQIRRVTYTPTVREYDLHYVAAQRSLYMSSAYSGIANLYRLDLERDTMTAVTTFYSPVYQFSITPGGDKLVLAAQNGGGYDLFLLRFPALQNVALDQVPKVEQLTSVEPSTTGSSISQKLSWQTIPLAKGKVRLRFDRQKLIRPQQTETAVIVDTTTGWQPDTAHSYTYKIRFSPDLILGTAGYDTYFGVLGQLQMLFSDVLGDHQIYVAANLLYDVNNSDFFVEYALLPYYTDYYFRGFHTARFVINNSQLYRFRYVGIGATAMIPLHRFERVEISGLGIGTFTENLDAPGQDQATYHWMSQVRFVHDDVLWSPYFEPAQGMRWFVGVDAIPSVLSSSLDYWTFRTDVRGYLPLWSRDFIMAARVSGAASVGKTPQRFYLLGIDQWLNPSFSNNIFPFATAEDLFFFSPVYPSRGAEVNEQSGRYFVAMNLELRFPLIRLFVPGALPVVLQNIRGALFSDLVGVWDQQFRFFEYRNGRRVPKNFFASVGLGTRFIVFGLPLRIDVAWKYTGEKFSAPTWLFSLGFAY